MSVDVIYTLTCEPEDDSPEDHFAYDTEKENQAAVKLIRDQLAAGNEWAWCVAKVTAEWNGFTGVAYLGACSYASAEDFDRCEGAQQRAEALDDLRRTLVSAIQRGKLAATFPGIKAA